MISSRMLMATITALATLGGSASAADHIKLGYMATLSGPFAMVGEEQQRGLNHVYISDVEQDGRGGMKLALKAIIAKDWQDDVHQQCPMKN
jgi:ABC-type branched-subunit amino acid transport system substrate-binding protein